MECWVLYTAYVDSPGAEIVRVYTDHQRAKEDFDLVSDQAYGPKYYLEESCLYGPESYRNQGDSDE